MHICSSSCTEELSSRSKRIVSTPPPTLQLFLHKRCKRCDQRGLSPWSKSHWSHMNETIALSQGGTKGRSSSVGKVFNVMLSMGYFYPYRLRGRFAASV